MLPKVSPIPWARPKYPNSTSSILYWDFIVLFSAESTPYETLIATSIEIITKYAIKW